MVISAATPISHRPFRQIVITLYLLFYAPYVAVNASNLYFFGANVRPFYDMAKRFKDFLE